MAGSGPFTITAAESVLAVPVGGGQRSKEQSCFITGLIGVDFDSETVLVGDIVDNSLTAVDIGDAVAAGLATMPVATLLAEVTSAVATFDVVAELVVAEVLRKGVAQLLSSTTINSRLASGTGQKCRRGRAAVARPRTSRPNTETSQRT